MLCAYECVFVYYLEREIQRLPPDHKLPASPKFVSKMLLTDFFDRDGVVHHEFFPAGQRVNKEHYLQILRRLPDAVGRKRPEHLSPGDWPIHHDNAPSHTSQLVQHFYAKNAIPQIEQPRYSPHVSPCDFFLLFHEIKLDLKGKRFDDVRITKRNTTQQLIPISKISFKYVSSYGKTAAISA